MNDQDDNWTENAKMVLFRLETLDRKMDKISDDLNLMKQKVAIWGFIAGLIPAGFMLAVEYLRK